MGGGGGIFHKFILFTEIIRGRKNGNAQKALRQQYKKKAMAYNVFEINKPNRFLSMSRKKTLS